MLPKYLLRAKSKQRDIRRAGTGLINEKLASDDRVRAKKPISRPHHSILEHRPLRTMISSLRQGIRLQMNEFLHFRAPHEKLGKGSVKSRAGESAEPRVAVQ